MQRFVKLYLLTTIFLKNNLALSNDHGYVTEDEKNTRKISYLDNNTTSKHLDDDSLKNRRIGAYNTAVPFAAPMGAPMANPAMNCYFVYTNNGGVPQEVCPPGHVPVNISTQPPKGVQDATSSPKPPLSRIKKLVGSGYSDNKKEERSVVERLNEIDPKLGSALETVFEYNGIKEPWSVVKDLIGTSHQQLPDPNMLYTKIKDMLKVFESVKEIVSKELSKVEIYVKRARSYLKEYTEALQKNIEKMNILMKKMKGTKALDIQNDYARKFNEVKSETLEIVSSYKKLKEWLVCTLSTFKQFF